MERNGRTLKPSNEHGIVRVLACTQQLLYILLRIYSMRRHVPTLSTYVLEFLHTE